MKTYVTINVSVALILLVLPALPSSNSFCPAVDAASTVELVGHVGGLVTAVAVEGTYAYIGMGPRLVILDISTPSVLTTIAQTNSLSGPVSGVAIAGNHAYVVDETAGLYVIDVSNPSVPFEAGSCSTPGESAGVAVAGDYAYVADGGSGMRVINVSNPAAPVEASSRDAPGCQPRMWRFRANTPLSPTANVDYVSFASAIPPHLPRLVSMTHLASLLAWLWQGVIRMWLMPTEASPFCS